jgi:hypothetical protein
MSCNVMYVCLISYVYLPTYSHPYMHTCLYRLHSYICTYLTTYLLTHLCTHVLRTCIPTCLSVHPALCLAVLPTVPLSFRPSIFSSPCPLTCATAYIPPPCIHIVPSTSYPYLMMSLYIPPPPLRPAAYLSNIPCKRLLLGTPVCNSGI